MAETVMASGIKSLKHLLSRSGKILASIIFGLALAVGVSAQNPVSWSLSPTKAVKAGSRLEARLSANISGGWYLYSLTQPAGGPNATRITIASEPMFKLAGTIKAPPPKTKFDENFGINTESYAGSVTFAIPLQVAAQAQTGRQALAVSVRFQVCNETTCLPPRSVKVEAPVEIASASTSLPNTNTNISAAVKASPAISPTPVPSPTPRTAITPEVNSTLNDQRSGIAGMAAESKSEQKGGGTESLTNENKTESGQSLVTDKNLNDDRSLFSSKIRNRLLILIGVTVLLLLLLYRITPWKSNL